MNSVREHWHEVLAEKSTSDYAEDSDANDNVKVLCWKMIEMHYCCSMWHCSLPVRREYDFEKTDLDYGFEFELVVVVAAVAAVVVA